MDESDEEITITVQEPLGTTSVDRTSMVTTVQGDTEDSKGVISIPLGGNKFCEEKEKYFHSTKPHCLICNADLPFRSAQVHLFVTELAASSEMSSSFLGGLVESELSLQKVHSSVACRRCFNLLVEADDLKGRLAEVTGRIVSFYHATAAIYERLAKPCTLSITCKKVSANAKEVERGRATEKRKSPSETAIQFNEELFGETEIVEEVELTNPADGNESADQATQESETKRLKTEIKTEVPDASGRISRKQRRGRKRGRHRAEKRHTSRPSQPDTRISSKQPLEKTETSHREIKQSESRQAFLDAVEAFDRDIHKIATLQASRKEFSSDGAKVRNGSESKPEQFKNVEESNVSSGDVDGQGECAKDIRPNTVAWKKLLTPQVERFAETLTDIQGEDRSSIATSESDKRKSSGNDHKYMDRSSFLASIGDSERAVHRRIQRKNAANQRLLLEKYTKKTQRTTRNSLPSLIRKSTKVTQHKPKKSKLICDVCDHVSSNQLKYYHHEYTAHAEKFPFPCNVCDHRFRTELLAREHELRHSEKDEVCPICFMKFVKENHLDYHASVKHSDCKRFQCKYCDRVSVSIKGLYQHIHIFHGELVQPTAKYCCQICSEFFHTGRALCAHRLAKHVPTSVCEFCGVEMTPHHLKVHINSVHSKEVKYPCQVCGKIFYSSSGLSIHRNNMHTEPKHFCSVCGKGYVTLPKLQRHLKCHEKVGYNN